MRGFRRQNAVQKWARFALRCGLLLTDAKLWQSIGSQLSDRVDGVSDEVRRRYEDVSDVVRDRYEDTGDRLGRAHDALYGHHHWVSPAASFVGGVGLGVGLGLLLAPASGEETRSALRHKVVDLKNRVEERVHEIGGSEGMPYRSGVRSSSTGTGDD